MTTKNRIIISLIVISLFVFTTFLFSDDIPEEQKNVCIWMIESDSNTVYLAGSLHYLKESDYPLDDRYYESFEDAENIVFEIHYDSTETLAFQQYIIMNAMCQEGKTLKDYLSDSTFALTRERLSELGMPIEKLHTFQPWFIGITMMSLYLQTLGFDAQWGIDQHFFQKAKKENKSILALESPEYQFDLLQSMGGDDQEDFLLQMIAQLEELDEGFNELFQAWQRGNLEVLDELLNKGFEEYPSVKQSLLVDRNYAWLDSIEVFVNDNKDYLVIVGSGHLAGDEGLVNLLREKGYHVEQVKIDKKNEE